MKIEKYNATITRTIPKFHLKWKQLLTTYKDDILKNENQIDIVRLLPKSA